MCRPLQRSAYFDFTGPDWNQELVQLDLAGRIGKASIEFSRSEIVDGDLSPRKPRLGGQVLQRAADLGLRPKLSTDWSGQQARALQTDHRDRGLSIQRESGVAGMIYAPGDRQ